MTLAYAFDRYSFGRPLASYQALKHRFADLKVALEACRAACATAVARAVQAEGTGPLRWWSAQPQVLPGAPRHRRLVQDCVQLHPRRHRRHLGPRHPRLPAPGDGQPAPPRHTEEHREPGRAHRDGRGRVRAEALTAPSGRAGNT